MKISWKQFKMFGVKITLPSVIIIVQQLNPEQIEQFKIYRAGMAECPKCHKLFGGRAGLSFIMHLTDDHSIESEKSMDIVADIYTKLLATTKARREAVDAAAMVQ